VYVCMASVPIKKVNKDQKRRNFRLEVQLQWGPNCPQVRFQAFGGHIIRKKGVKKKLGVFGSFWRLSDRLHRLHPETFAGYIRIYPDFLCCCKCRVCTIEGMMLVVGDAPRLKMFIFIWSHFFFGFFDLFE
jgi:hypothetical protein